MRDGRKASPRARRGSTLRCESLEGRALLTTASFRVVTDWGSGFTGEIRIDNTESTPINAWKLEFDFAPAIGSIWNGVVAAHVGQHYTVAGEAWDKDVPAGGSATFGFNASPGNLGTAQPINWKLNGVPLGGSTPATIGLSVDDVSVTEGDPPAPTAPSAFFHTSGSQIVDASGKSVKIAGVNWFGFETSNFAPHGLWARSYRDMMDQMKSLGFNTIRLPYSNQLFDAGSAPNGIDFSKNPDLAGLNGLGIMDRIVDYAGKIGLRIMLDHHRSTAGNSAQESGLWYTPTYPESRWIDDWKMLAQRYKGNPAVTAADLHNEPHGPATWGTGGANDWRLAAQRAGDAILAVNPDWLIVVEGIEAVGSDYYWWGGNLSAAGQFPVQLSVPGRLVYSPHDYPQSVYDQRWFSAADYPNNLPSVWDQHWGYLFRTNDTPILLGEFGSKLATTKDRQWADKMIAYLKGDLNGDGTNDLAAGKEGPSWTWWAWNPNSGDTGGILNDDWTTVRTDAVNLLKPIEFVLPGASTGTTAPRSAVFTISMTQASSTPISVAFGTADGTAKAGVDYQAASGSITFAPGEKRKTVSVPISGDKLVEGNETFFLRLSGPTAATIVDGEGLATILDDDAGAPTPALPSIRVVGASVKEGNSGTSPLPFTVTLSAASTSTVSVDYAFVDGTAKSGSDYQGTSGRLTFAPGETSKFVNASILGDATVEPDETFSLALANPVGATLGVASATGAILNDDVAPPPPPPPSSGSYKYAVRDDWGSGFVADATLTNAGATAWKSWTLAFDLDATLTNIWNAQIVSHVGTRYVLQSLSYNGVVPAGSSVGFGFQASTSSGKSRTPTNVTLNGVPLG